MANKTFPEIDRVATRQDDDLFVFHRAGQEYTQTREKLMEAVTPAYTEYIALLTQTGTNAPVATVLNSTAENYLGAITWARGGTGEYSGTLTGVFTANKTYMQLNNTEYTRNAGIRWSSANLVSIRTADGSGSSCDEVLNGSSVIIRVYA